MNEKAIEELVKSSREISKINGQGIYRPDITYELLYEMYIVKRMSIREIARELGCDPGTVWHKLKEFEIKTRSVSEALRDETIWSAEWDQFQKEVLDGLMLGDGSLHSGTSHMSFSYNQACKHKEFVKHVMNIFPDIFEENGLYIAGEDLWAIESRVNKYLTEQRHRYYPEGVKVVPEDIKVTPTVLLYWYLGDGNLKDGDYVSISCYSLYNGLDLVIPQLEKMGLFFRKWCNGVGLPKACNDRFFELIGEKLPVECFAYKWPSKYLTSEEMVLGYKYKRGLL